MHEEVWLCIFLTFHKYVTFYTRFLLRHLPRSENQALDAAARYMAYRVALRKICGRFGWPIIIWPSGRPRLSRRPAIRRRGRPDSTWGRNGGVVEILPSRTCSQATELIGATVRNAIQCTTLWARCAHVVQPLKLELK